MTGVVGDARTLSESASKRLLADFGLPIAPEAVVEDASGAVAAADRLGYPAVVKLLGDTITHKTERGLVRLNLTDADAVRQAASELLATATPGDGDVCLLVMPMVRGVRELIVGLVRDPQFGPMVMVGVGGVLAEAIADVAFRPAILDGRVLDEAGAHDLIGGLTCQRLLGAFRGEAAVDRDALALVLIGLAKLSAERGDVASAEVNPLVVRANGSLVAVDALVELTEPSTRNPHPEWVRPRPTAAQFQALFEPRGVLVTGASSHPGKFGFVALHNLLAAGYAGGAFGPTCPARRCSE